MIQGYLSLWRMFESSWSYQFLILWKNTILKWKKRGNVVKMITWMKNLISNNYLKLITAFIILNLLTIQTIGINGHTSILNNIQIYNSTTVNSSNRFEGYNLFVLEQHNYSTSAFISRKILISDLEGDVIFERDVNPNIVLADQPIEFINSTTILYGDYDGTKLWNIETNVTVNMFFKGHHEIEMDYLRNTYFTFGTHNIEVDNNTYIFDLINEYNASGHLIRSIDTSNYVELWHTCPFEDKVNGTVDLTHANSLVFDEDEDMMYLNCRNTNTFYKIDYQTGDLIWSLGEYGNFTMYDIYGNQRDYLFFHSHSLEKIDSNRFLLFDNDFHNQTDATNRESRLVEITVDEDKMQANVTWEWTGPENYWSVFWGDCDILPNDNKLGVFGFTSSIEGIEGAKVVEVNNNGTIVWELSSPLEEDLLYAIYGMERFRFSPITSAPILNDLGNNQYFEWDLWYNFRSKTNFTGEYFIYLDNQMVDNKNITFPKFWKSINVKYYTGEITPGEHQISIVVADEGGHLSNDSAFYNNIGTIHYEVNRNIKLILGLSLGIGVPVSVALVFTWLKYFRKRVQQ